MKHLLFFLTMLLLFALTAPVWANDRKLVKQRVDAMVEAINKGKPATDFAADTYTPYVFIMEASGKLLVHPYLQEEYLPEKAAPIYEVLQQATQEGIWVQYLWKGAEKTSYVRRTNNNLILGSGY